jgi:DNA-binding response OmpR family regulator
MRIQRVDVMQNPHVLVVEDSEMVSVTLCTILDEHYEVSCATSAEKAAQELRRQCIQIILLDYHLAGQNGQTVIGHADRTGVPVVWMTGDPGALEELGESSRPLLSKPFGICDVLTTITNVLASP